MHFSPLENSFNTTEKQFSDSIKPMKTVSNLQVWLSQKIVFQ
jgi:hypothetical protein